MSNATKLLDKLEKGLRIFKSKIKKRKDAITAKLARNEKLSTEEEEWLDGEGNTVDQDRVVDIIQRANSPERVMKEMNEGDRKVAEELCKMGEEPKPLAGDRRKRGNFEKAPAKPKPSTPDSDEEADGPLEPLPGVPMSNPSVEQKLKVLDWFHANGQSQSATVAHFRRLHKFRNVRFSQSSISKWLKEEASFRAHYDGATQHELKSKRIKQTELPHVTEMMELWIEKACNDGMQLTAGILRQKWEDFEELAGVPQEDRLKKSNGWLDSLKKRMGLRRWKRHGEAGSANPEDVEKERQRIRDIIANSGYELRDIYNMDETGLFYAMVPDTGLSNAKRSGVKGQKVRITYAFTANATGSHKLPPLIIGRAKQPRAFRRKTGEQLGFFYRHNAKAWMTTVIYQEWIRKWDEELQQQNRKILLLQDNFSAHVPPPDIRNIRVENFEPNLTSHVQPLDQGIIRCFKARYRAAYIRRSVDRYDNGITPSQVYDIDQLQAMRLAESAWHEVDASTISNCWRKAGILPPAVSATSPSLPISNLINDPVDGVVQAENELTNALDHLQATGVLQAKNRMAIEFLVNPADENINMDEATDQDIYDAVMEARQARELIDINGGDDDEEPVSERPSPKEVRKAVGIITDFLLHSEDQYARKLEVLLSSLQRDLRLEETRGMKSTRITDFFS